MSADAMRASDSDRERVVQALQEQVGEGRLTLPEFEQRTNAAYAATTVGDLRTLLTDLPVDLFPQPAPGPAGPFGMGGGRSAWSGPFPLPANPPWQRRRIQRAGGPNPLVFLVIGIVALMAVGELAAMVLPFLLPIVIIGFVLLRVAGRAGRRY